MSLTKKIVVSSLQTPKYNVCYWWSCDCQLYTGFTQCLEIQRNNRHQNREVYTYTESTDTFDTMSDTHT